MTNIISKSDFIEAINSIQIQLYEDKKNAEIVAEMFQASEFNLYDNNRLICTIIKLLSFWFPKEDLEHYCFQLNFGKNGEEYESPEEFYDALLRFKQNQK